MRSRFFLIFEKTNIRIQKQWFFRNSWETIIEKEVPLHGNFWLFRCIESREMYSCDSNKAKFMISENAFDDAWELTEKLEK